MAITIIKSTISVFSQTQEREIMAAMDVVVIRPILSMVSVYPKNCGHFLQASTFQFPVSNQNSCRNPYLFSYTRPVYATLNSPKGFGPPPKKSKKNKKSKMPFNEDDDNNDNDNDDGYDEPDAGIIPEVVTNRMISRMGLSVGVPLFIGLLFFPFFYYLKVGLKIDVPSWVPFIVSFFFFGTALLGVSYGIVSASWDPMREGSLLGWNEAQKNWPVFWQSFLGRSSKD